MPAELLRVAVFVLLVVGIFVGAAFTIVKKLRKRPAQRGGRLLVALAGLGTLCVLYGALVEPNWLETTHVPISSSKLARPLRIAHISDLHCEGKPRLEDSTLPEAIERERPDAIVFTGDSTNALEGIPVLRRLLARLARVAPTYCVRGNWDAGGHKLGWQEASEVDARLGMFEGTGARELDGEAAPLRSDVWVAGIPVFGRSKIAATLARVPQGAFTVFLCHWPDEIEEVSRLGADLYLAGHTHGGQVALPFYGALVTFSKFGKDYEAGLYRVGPTQLYVNRGIGMDGQGAPRVRFWARPELTILELSPATK